MRTLLAVVFTTCLLGFMSACTHNAPSSTSAGSTTVTGILIDQACGTTMLTKDDPEKEAAAHPKSCAVKDACAQSGYAVISGKDMIKFDDNGNALAKAWLAKTDKVDNLRVTVEGTRTGDTIAVTSLTAAGEMQ